MFLDEAIIEVRGGNGGGGCVSWRREKYVAKGGPNGGDGGRGGNVVFQADEHTDTLSNFSSRKRFEAENGKGGQGSNKHGRDGEDIVLLVPPGTIIRQLAEDGSSTIVADLTLPGDRVTVAKGGRGGYGNAHFVNSVRQRPEFAELGEPGEGKKLHLELKLVADIGIIGYPSVGKSTLISVISAAKPKIAAYPFTTLVPNLGVVTVDDRSYVVCDVPGLIEGASEGKGLGDTFLRHIERTGALLHVLDIERALREGGEVSVDQLMKDYRAIRTELEAYSPALTQKRELVILNKADLIAGQTTHIVSALEKEGLHVFASISAATRQGTDDLVKKLLPIVLEEREKRVATMAKEAAAESEELPVLRPGMDDEVTMRTFTVQTEEDGSIRVRGKRLEQMVAMTNFDNQGAVRRFRDIVDRTGLKQAIRRARKGQDVPVWIGEKRVEGYL